MRNLTDERPKCLLELRGRPLLDWQLESLRAAGIDQIALVTGYRSAMLTGRGLTEFHNPRWAETNMVTSLACAREWLQSGPCVVSYADIVYEADAVRLLSESNALLAVTYDPNWLGLWRKRFEDPLEDAETFRLNADGSLAEIGAVPQSVDEVEGQYMGLLRFTPQAWEEVGQIRSSMPQSLQDKMHMTGTLQKVIEAGRVPVVALPYRGWWGEVDTEGDLRELHA
jgi:choline kinase